MIIKKLMTITAAILLLSSFGYAQEVTESEYERMIENTLNIELRAYAIESLGLNEEETEFFTPIFFDYTEAKDELMEEKNELLKEYEEEMAEDDSKADEREETADFIEHYWKLQIASSELRNDYYDKLEDELGPYRALEFFLIEESMESALQQMQVAEFIPVYRIVQEDSKMKNRKYAADKKKYNWNEKGKEKAYKDELKAYNKWVNKNKGNASLDHEYTHKGISQLTRTMAAMADAQGLSDSKVRSTKKELMGHADQLKKNPMTDEHADIARKAFDSIASMLTILHEKGKDASSVQKVHKAAEKIDPDELLLDQEAYIYNFFESAQGVVNEIDTTMASNSYDNDSSYNEK